jgi:hypothetical protein
MEPPRKSRLLVSLGIACALFLLNNIGILSGWLAPPPGYEPDFFFRGGDLAQYVTWANGFRDLYLLPDYLAPWQTEARFFNFVVMLVGRLASWLHVDVRFVYLALQLGAYWLATYCFLWALQVFGYERRERIAAVCFTICSLPLTSVKLFVLLVTGRAGWRSLPGLQDFFWWSSDGFFHGIGGSALVSLGTGLVLLFYCLVGSYLKTGERRFLKAAGLTAFVSAFAHPFEIFAVGPAAALAIFWTCEGKWKRAVGDVFVLGVPAVLGVLPYVLLSMTTPWMHLAALKNRWTPEGPLRMLIILGLPSILALVLLVLRPRMAAKSDALLQTSMMCVLVGVYVPFLPWSQHLLSGYYYMVGLLLARQVFQIPSLKRAWERWPRLAGVGLAVWVLSGVTTYAVYVRQAYADGRDAENPVTLSTVAPVEERLVIDWLRKNARPEQLVLAPPDLAPWLATVPMHSFAAHQLFSLTYGEQRRLSENFFDGRLSQEEAKQLLEGYGVRFVVLPKQSAAAGYLASGMERTVIGSLRIVELPGNEMKPMPASILKR